MAAFKKELFHKLGFFDGLARDKFLLLDLLPEATIRLMDAAAREMVGRTLEAITREDVPRCLR